MQALNTASRQAYLEQFRRDHSDKIFVAIDLHDHQPIYRPGVDPADTPEIRQNILGSGDADNRREVYKDAEAYAIEAMPSHPHFGIQVSYSGSLMENLQKTAQRGLWPGDNWNAHYRDLRAATATVLGNPRLDFVNIGYHHPLMGLIATGQADADKDITLQIKMHRSMVGNLFGKPISKGFFPPEMAFSERMLPALERAGVDWVMVDNIHVDRANADYNNPQDGLKPPNGGDARNAGRHSYETMPNDLAKTHQVSADALRPHYVKHIDPTNGNETLMVVVPEERSLSSFIQKDRDASKLSEILNRFSKYNTDPNHPLLVLYCTDGDNNGSNSGEFHRHVPIDLATRYPDQVVLTTVQDYLDMFPPEKPRLVSDEGGVRRYQGGDVVHVEDGAWWGANLGDPEYSKWADYAGLSVFTPKNNSWATLTAAKNHVLTADALEPAAASDEGISHIIADAGSDTERAWHGLLLGQTSDYEYWGPQEPLSYSSITAANEAVEQSRKVLVRHGAAADKVGPSIFVPMRNPYNPTDRMEVATFAYDVSGIGSVHLKYRVGTLSEPRDFTYDAAPWDEVPMEASTFPDLPHKPDVWVEPQARADIYRGHFNLPITSAGQVVQYYVEAVDALGNRSRSPIQSVKPSVTNEK